MKKYCHHCKDPIVDEVVRNELSFCCNGCASVHELLTNENFQSIVCDLDLNTTDKGNTYFDELNNPEIEKEYIKFRNQNISLIQLYIPSIHCSSCVWLFEKLPSIDPRIIDANVNFESRTVQIKFYHDALNSFQLAVFLRKMGYPPDLKVKSADKRYKSNRKEIMKLGIAGFCFGNIMLFSVPDYLSLDDIPAVFQKYFGILSILLALPIVFYSGWDYFKKAILSIKMKKVDINVPIALGIATILLFSTYDILIAKQSGFLDSLAGLVFFLLLGQFFQNKLFEQFKRERDLESFFPLAILKKSNNQWIATPIQDIQVNDIIKIRNEEIIPVSAQLLKGNANIDNSFITGESILQKVELNETIYAGGKQMGEAIELKVLNSFEQDTWNQMLANKEEEYEETIIDKIAGYFTWIVISIAVAGGLFWLNDGWYTAIRVFSTVLIIACPCALALSTPITYGNLLRRLAKNGFYIKSVNSLPKFKTIKEVVLDKTGTLTFSDYQLVKEKIEVLSESEKILTASLAAHSAHPYSDLLVKSINPSTKDLLEVSELKEVKGKGVSGKFDGTQVLIGSKDWLIENGIDQATKGLNIAIDHKIVLNLSIEQPIRPGITQLLSDLKTKLGVTILSGDTQKHVEAFKQQIPSDIDIKGEQSPQDKVNFVKNKGNTLMIGDGLNDAGALLNANIGIAVNDQTHAYFPKSDGLIFGSKLKNLNSYLRLINWSHTVIIICILFSFMYNLVGLYFALQLKLSPFVAAILMPLSSVSILLISAGLMKLKKLE